MTHHTLRLTLPFALFLALACKKQDEPAATAGYQAATPGGAGGPAVGPATGPVAAAGAPAALPAPAPAPTAPAGPDPALIAAATPLVTALAKTQVVAGSKELGPVFVGNVGGAVTLEQQVTLTPNKCYSVVAVGLPPISELNISLNLTTPLPALSPVLAVDQDAGGSAVLGKKPTCYKFQSLIPVVAKAVITAAGGQGIAAAQIFEK